MDVLTSATQNYMDLFANYVDKFLSWGQWLFLGLVSINLVWMTLWYAFDKQSIAESMPQFIKRFFTLSLFYTIMIHPHWLVSLLETSTSMGHQLTNLPLDPSSMIENGLAIANKIISPITNSSLLTLGFGVIIIALVYIIVLFAFIGIALELALTLIITTALISMASFFLGFAALGTTQTIARQTLDTILAHCVKVLGIYLVIAAGDQCMVHVAQSIPEKVVNFDAYAWVVSVALLFWLVAKNLPNQLARIVSSAFHENRGTEVSALAMAGMRFGQQSSPILKASIDGTKVAANLSGAIAYNAATHLQHGLALTGSLSSGVGAAIGGSTAHLGKAMVGNVADHFKQVASKLVGGSASQQSVQSISERMHQASRDIKTIQTKTEKE